MELIVFDMDGVLIEERSSWRIIHREFGINNSDIIQKLRQGKLSQREFLDMEVKRMRERGITRKDIISAIKKVRYMKGMEKCLNFIKDRKSAIISGGMKCIADRIALHGIDIVFANEIEYKGEVPWRGILNVPFFNKDVVLKDVIEKVGADFVIVIGDSKYDARMFELADISIAFNPNDDVVVERADEVVIGKNMEDLIKILKKHL